MKVCMIVPNRNVQGGIASVTNGYRDNKYLNERVQIKYIESYVNGNKLRKLLKALCAYIRFVFVLIFFRPQIVHIHSSFGPSFYRKKFFIDVAHFFKIKIINHIHGADFESFYVNADKNKKRQIKITYNKCDLLIALSDEWKDKLSRIVESNKVVVLQNYCVVKEGVKRDSNKNNTVLFLGEIGERKGCYDIPAIVASVKKTIPASKFIIAGKGTPKDEVKFKGLCADLGVSESVSMPGWIRGEEKDEALMNADLFILPSYNEGMPMSILDAMGYALPIVSTNVGGIPKIVINDFNGYTFDPGDVRGASSAIVKILTDASIYKKMSESSYSLAKGRFSLDAHVRKLVDLYFNVI